MKFLLKVADMVKSIWIFHRNTEKITAQVDIVPFIKSMLNRKCEKLEINEHFSGIALSLADIQDLLQVKWGIESALICTMSAITVLFFQFLHHTEKNFAMFCKPPLDPLDAQIGNYKVFSDGSCVSIRQLYFRTYKSRNY